MPGAKVDADALVTAVRELSSEEEPVVTSDRLKRWFEQKGLDWGAAEEGRKGRHFEAADADAVPRGLLEKWKRRGAPNAAIGWSEPVRRSPAKAWAAREGWDAVS